MFVFVVGVIVGKFGGKYFVEFEWISRKGICLVIGEVILICILFVC